MQGLVGVWTLASGKLVTLECVIRGARADLHIGRVTVLLCAEYIIGYTYQGSHGKHRQTHGVLLKKV